MKLKKIISSGLALCLVFNSISLSLAGIISKDGRYETFEGNTITIDNVLEEDKVDIEIEGNTLVNVLSYKTSDNFLWLDGTVDDDGYIEITADGQFKNFFINKEDISVKPNTTYTYFLEIAENTLVRDDGGLSNCIRIGGTHETSRPSYWKDCVWISGGTTGKYKFTLTTKDSFEDVITGDRGYVNWTTSGKLKMRYMIIEGNHMDKDLDYFEGIKSSFEDDAINNKSFNIELTSSNANLFNHNSEYFYPIGGLNIYGSVLKENETTFVYNGPETTTHNYGILFKNIELKPNTTYNLKYNFKEISNCSYSGFTRIYINDSTNKNDLIYEKNSNNFSFTTNDNNLYQIAIYGAMGNMIDCNFKISDILISEDEISYIKNMKNKINIALSEPLRALPNGVKDRIMKRNGQWIVERNCGEVILDGDEDWELSYLGLDNTLRFVCNNINNVSLLNGDNIFYKSDRFVSYTSNYSYGNDFEAISGKDGFIYLRINKSRLSRLDLEGFKIWLRENPVKVVYQLETPIYEPLNIDSTINTYLDTTHISNNSNIPANMKVTIDRAINRATEAIQLAKENPTIENISQARYWANLMKETIKKDEVNNQINDITTPVDLNIEKKKASANVDVYVKSDNSLSMTLSTNSITFDKYTGTDDIEKNSALEITVHSSLPYDLNAYLEDNIQNSDKSVVMDSNLLQIKESNDVDYKSFVNTKDKIVLAENNSYGNYKKHSIDLKIEGSNAYKAGIYKTTIKFEAKQK